MTFLLGAKRAIANFCREEIFGRQPLAHVHVGGHPRTVSVPILDVEGLAVPRYALPGDAGADLCAAEQVTIAPGRRAVMSTNVSVAIPNGCVGLIHPRSGLAAKHGITVLNAPGTIDSAYRGEIKVILLNTDLDNEFVIRAGDRVAQLVIQKFEQATFIRTAELPASTRGTAGFGSTGQ